MIPYRNALLTLSIFIGIGAQKIREFKYAVNFACRGNDDILLMHHNS